MRTQKRQNGDFKKSFEVHADANERKDEGIIMINDLLITFSDYIYWTAFKYSN